MHAIAPGFLCCCLVIECRFSSFQGKHLVTCSLYPASSCFACFFCYCCLDLFPLFMDAHTHTTAHSAVIWLNYCHYFGWNSGPYRFLGSVLPKCYISKTHTLEDSMAGHSILASQTHTLGDSAAGHSIPAPAQTHTLEDSAAGHRIPPSHFLCLFLHLKRQSWSHCVCVACLNVWNPGNSSLHLQLNNFSILYSGITTLPQGSKVFRGPLPHRGYFF